MSRAHRDHTAALIPEYFDIALRDLGLALHALALAPLADAYNGEPI